jgi:YggT family protein
VFIVANFLLAIAKITDIVLTLYLYIIIARALLSWVNPDPYNPIVNFLYRITEPVLYRVRRVMPDMGGIDLSPMLIMLGIFFIQKFAINSVYEVAYRLKMGGMP